MPTVATQAKGEGALRDSSRKTSISAVLDNPNLPSPPALVLQILEKVSKPDCDPSEVLSLLAQDSGLCGQVLKTVNSGLFGLTRSVGTLKQAVMILGLRPLRSLVLSLALPAIRVTDRDELLVKYWQESVSGAVIARELAKVLGRRDPEDDLMAGLLRDLGFLVFREAFPDEYRTLWKQNEHCWSVRQSEAERETFGVDHAEISAVVLESWNLPAEIHQPIRHHHDPEGCTDAPESIQQRAWLLCFASKVATLHGTSTTTVTELLQFAQKQFGMNQTALIKFLSSVTPIIQEFAGLLKVSIGECPNYSAIIGAGCQELVRLTVESGRSTPPVGRGSKSANAEPEHDQTQTYSGPGISTKNGSHRNGPGPEFDSSCLTAVPPGGAWLNGYEIKEILGRGAMGVVFKAYDPALDRFAAIKMMTPERVISSEAREWFKREARAAAAIQHENVITIYAVSDMNGLPYLVMEYLTGTSLQDTLDQEGPLPLKDVIRFGRQIASGLHAAQIRRVIHRDIKPANVLFTRDGNGVKITDFGLARVCDDVRRTQDGVWVGTPMYMAPEQFSSVGVDHRADLFSLGSLIYALATGKPPFQAETIPALMLKVCNSVPAPVRTIRPEVPIWLADLIGKLLAKQPESRCQSAAEVVQEIDRHV